MNKVEKLCCLRKLNINNIKYLIDHNIIRSWNKYKIGINIYINKIFDKYVDLLDEKEVCISRTLIKVINGRVYIRCEVPLLDEGYNTTWDKIIPFFLDDKLLYNGKILSIVDRFHEAMEIKYSLEFLKLYRFVKNDCFKCITKNGREIISKHADLRVLKDEFNIVNYGSLFESNIDALKKYRLWRGDYTLIKLSNKKIKQNNEILSNRIGKNRSWLYQYYVT